MHVDALPDTTIATTDVDSLFGESTVGSVFEGILFYGLLAFGFLTPIVGGLYAELVR